MASLQLCAWSYFSAVASLLCFIGQVPRRYATSLSTYYNGHGLPSTTSTGRSFPSPTPMKGKNLAHVTTLLSDRIREMQTDAPVECSGNGNWSPGAGDGNGNGNWSPGMTSVKAGMSRSITSPSSMRASPCLYSPKHRRPPPPPRSLRQHESAVAQAMIPGVGRHFGTLAGKPLYNLSLPPQQVILSHAWP